MYLKAFFFTLLLIMSFNVFSEDLSKKTETDAKTFISNLMKDPESAMFRNVYTLKKKNKKGEISFNVCGEVNAKNSYGGYAGYKPFYFSKDWGEILTNDNAEIFKMMFEVVCQS